MRLRLPALRADRAISHRSSIRTPSLRCFLNRCPFYSGFGAHLARPLFREKHRDDMSEAEARALLEEGLRVSSPRHS